MLWLLLFHKDLLFNLISLFKLYCLCLTLSSRITQLSCITNTVLMLYLIHQYLGSELKLVYDFVVLFLDAILFVSNQKCTSVTILFLVGIFRAVLFPQLKKKYTNRDLCIIKKKLETFCCSSH